MSINSDPQWNADLNVAGLALLVFSLSKLKDRAIVFGWLTPKPSVGWDIMIGLLVLFAALLVLKSKHPAKDPNSFMRRSALLYGFGMAAIAIYLLSFLREAIV